MVNSCPAREVITSMSAPCWMRSFTQPKWPFLAATISGVWEAGKREEREEGERRGGEKREREEGERRGREKRERSLIPACRGV